MNKPKPKYSFSDDNEMNVYYQDVYNWYLDNDKIPSRRDKFFKKDDDYYDVLYDDVIFNLKIKRRKLIAMKCCEENIKTKSVFLQIKYDYIKAVWLDPRWACYAPYEDNGHNSYKSIPAQFCPHCGTKVRGIKKNLNPPSPIHVYNNNGYCRTCKERCCNCCCYSPEYAYEEENV